MKTRWIQLLILLQCNILAQGALAADFSGANLRGVHLKNANLRGSNLNGADLTDANLSGTGLRDTNITQQQLDSACGSGTKLPAGLSIQSCPAPLTAGLDTHATGQRMNANQAPPEAHDNRDASSRTPGGVLVTENEASPRPTKRQNLVDPGKPNFEVNRQ